MSITASNSKPRFRPCLYFSSSLILLVLHDIVSLPYRVLVCSPLIFSIMTTDSLLQVNPEPSSPLSRNVTPHLPQPALAEPIQTRRALCRNSDLQYASTSPAPLPHPAFSSVRIPFSSATHSRVLLSSRAHLVCAAQPARPRCWAV